MSMSKKDFISLADLIRNYNADINRRNQKAKAEFEDPDTFEQWFSDDQIRALADFCQAQNPNFMRGRWLDYIAGKCGPNGGSK